MIASGARMGTSDRARADASATSPATSSAPTTGGAPATVDSKSEAGTGGASILDAATGSAMSDAAVADAGAVLDAGQPTDAAQAACTTCGTSTCRDIQTDSEHCGSCQRSCEGGACQKGTCKPAVVAQALQLGADTSDLALDATRLYWATPRGVFAVAKSGGQVSTLVAAEMNNLGSIAVDASNVYWTWGPQPRVFDKVSITGGAVTNIGSNFAADSVASDGASVYFTSSSPDGAILRLSPSGGAPVVLVEQSDAGIGFANLAIGGDRIYWVSTAPGSYDPMAVMSASTSGGSGTVVHSVDPNDRIRALAASGLDVFWNAGPAGQDLWGNAPPLQPMMIARSGGIVDIATSNSDVFWTDGYGVYKAPARGGPAITLAAAQTLSAGIAVDEASVYWLSRGSSTITKVPR